MARRRVVGTAGRWHAGCSGRRAMRTQPRNLLRCTQNLVAVVGAAAALAACSAPTGDGAAATQSAETVYPQLNWPSFSFSGKTYMAPAAASWGPGRIDMFVRDASDGTV